MRQPGCGKKDFGKRLCVYGWALLGCAGQAHTEPAVVPQAPAVALAEPTTPAPAVPSSVPNPASDGSSSQLGTTETTPAEPEAAAPTDAPPTPAPESPALTTLHRYYADLNGHQFEAVRYFAPSVNNYITMRRPSSGAIDHYIRDVFPKQFESYEFLLDEATLHPEEENVLTYVERSRYYVVKAHEFRESLAQVRVEFDADGKIVDFRHVKVLALEKTPELRGP